MDARWSPAEAGPPPTEAARQEARAEAHGTATTSRSALAGERIRTAVRGRPSPLHGNYLKPAKKRLVEEGERQAEIERQRWEDQREHWRRKDEEQRAAKALEDSQVELLQVIDAWAELKRFEAFFADAERRAQDLPDEQRERTIAPSTGARSDRQHRCA